jgi:predicted phosphohydrolase
MRVWGIADLHLSFARPEPRERYAARWRDHAARIEANWRDAVGRDDLVLLPGDLSMARNHRELQPDLAWIDRLPGTKVLAPGNHDRWWNGVNKVRPMLRRSLLAVGGGPGATHRVVICRTTGGARP